MPARRRLPSARNAFLDRFDRDLLPHLLAYANEITGLDVDVLVFTARKAACLFDAMRSLGLVTTKVPVVSDRVLDMDLNWLSGKRVALIDDVLITGSSLFRAREKLIAAGVSDVRTLVLAVNKDWWVPSLIEPSQPYVLLEDRASLHFCTQIVDALSVVPRPYNLDWPLLEGIAISEEHAHALSASARWAQTETTSLLQHSLGVRTMTHDLRSAYIPELEVEMGLPLREARLLKSRIYARSSKGELRLRVLPMASLGDLPVASVDGYFELLTKKTNPLHVRQFTSATSRMRLIQYVLSARLGRIWSGDFNQLLPGPVEPQFGQRQVAFAFPPHLEADVIRLAQNDLDLSEVRWGESAMPPHRDELRLTVAMQALLTAPFIQMYREKEIPARETLKAYGPDAFTRPDAKGVLDRLDNGISLDHLEQHVHDEENQEFDLRRALSAFVDSAVDHGIAVPVTREDSGYLRRVYRHGEDVLFSQSEQQLFAMMLAMASNNRGTALPRLETEKLCVLLLRIAYRAKILHPWTGGPHDGRQYIGVRYDLHGAVAKTRLSKNDSLFEYTPDVRSVARVLVDSKLIELSGGVYVPAAGLLDAPTGNDAQRLARGVGAMFGDLLRPNAPIPFDANDLTLLATCEEPHHVLAALAAEVDIIMRGIDSKLNELRLNLAGRKVSSQVHEVSQRVVAAANSGVRKYRAYSTGKVDEIIARVSGSLEFYAQQTWDSFWSLQPAPESQIPGLAKTAGEWLTILLANLRVAELAVRVATSKRAVRQASFEKVRNTLESESQVVQGKRRTDWLGRTGERLAELERDPSTAQQIAAESIEEISSLIALAGPILDKARAGINRWGEPATWLEYDGAVLIGLSDGAEPPWLRDAIDAETRRGLERQYGLRRFRFENAPHLLVIATRGRNRGGPVALAARIASHNSRGTVRLAVIPTLSEADHIYADVDGAEPQGRGFVKLALSLGDLLQRDRASSLLAAVGTADMIGQVQSAIAGQEAHGEVFRAREAPQGYLAAAVRLADRREQVMSEQPVQADKPMVFKTTIKGAQNVQLNQGQNDLRGATLNVGDVAGLIQAAKGLGLNSEGLEDLAKAVHAPDAERPSKVRSFLEKVKMGAYGIAIAGSGEFLAVELEKLIHQYLGG